MAKGNNQKLKLYYLAKIMLEKTDENHGLTIPEIIEELDKYDISAERKSLYDDFRVLTDIGIEIGKCNEGKRFEYFVLSRHFELAELKLLVDSIQSSKFITEKKSKELISKIESFASVYEAKSLQRHVFVQNRIKTVNESIYYSVDSIHNAIAANKKIKFQYFNWNTKKEMELRYEGNFITVSPWALSWDDENYYLIAFDSVSCKIKHYRVDKMLKISIINEKRQGKLQFDGFNPALYAKQNFSMFGGELKDVKLELKNEYAGIIIDRFGRDLSFRPISEDKSVVYVQVALSNHFYSWIFTLKDGVKIIEPESVVNDVKQYIKEIGGLYEVL